VTVEAYEAGNRRAEVDGAAVAFFRVTGKVRRSKHGFWHCVCPDVNAARRLAVKWMRTGKLGDRAIVGG